MHDSITDMTRHSHATGLMREGDLATDGVA